MLSPDLQKRKEDKERHSTILFLIRNAKKRAKKIGVEFTLTPDNLPFVEECPVCLIKMERNAEQFRENSFTLDRLNPKGGYTPDNVRVISWRANKAKGDLSNEEIERLYLYTLGKI